MVKRTRLDGSNCPVARSVDAIGDWWALLIVRDAFDGSRRFGEFQRSLGIAKNILATRLRELVGSGILDLVPAADGGARHEYVLTAKGRDLFPVVVALRQWGEAHFFDPGEPHSEMVDLRHGRTPRPLEVRAADGRLLGPDDVTVRKVERSGAPEPV
ncbi:helix-turn-helix domain-containing protein [Streptomyces sp. ML-6]|uniref:winged helix-turn-helix transcriptional regulator n=1 Tax=Streptomyces sp. ML-6 TaxID=2982693 RepID=UPI0024C0612C|nr:helix-turn-helix domain-containing protein [Streptomyces sp. ML-6]MDK0523743.1 helix-turn-helix transcriptional regulator [Streptomyces sp. ML-6]